MQNVSLAHRLARRIRLALTRTSPAEKTVSVIGAVAGIAMVTFISFQATGFSGAALIVPSMGASAVLLFAVPHGQLSQPWSLFGGHLISAVIGVLCYRYISGQVLAAGLAVGLAVGAMHLANCIHPPGGATALAGVVGGPAIHALGFKFLLTPILLNTVIIFIIAVLFNSFFPWRRYPVGLMRFKPVDSGERAADVQIDSATIQSVLKKMDIVVDITIDELKRIIQLVLEKAGQGELKAEDIKLGCYYTNNRHGKEWSVRQIIDEHPSDDPEKDMVIYRVVEGLGLRSAGSCTRTQFSLWAARQLQKNGTR